MASQRLNDSVQKLILLVVLFCNNFLLLLIQVLTFYFPDCGKLAPPVVQVQAMSFKYGKDKVIVIHIDVKLLYFLSFIYFVRSFCIF